MSLYEIGRKLKGLKASRRKFTGNILYNHDYDRDLPTDGDFNSLVNAYRGWAYIAGSRNATSVAQAELKLYATKSSKNEKIRSFPTKEVPLKEKEYIYKNPSLIQKRLIRQSEDVVEILDHPFLDLMTNVNGFMNRFTLFETTEMFLSMVGNCYWYLISNRLGVPVELWVLPPQNVRIVPDKGKFIKGYEYFKGGCGFYRQLDGIFYKEKDIVHFKMPNPTNYYYGTGHLQPVLDEYVLGRQMNEYESAIFKNGQKISGSWETDSELGEFEFNRLKEEIKNVYGGNSNVGKNPLLDNGLKFKPFSYYKQDLSYKEGREWIKDIVLSSYGITLGMYDSAATRSNSQEAIQLYNKSTIRPKLFRIEEKINEKILPRYSDRLFASFSDPVASDRELDLRELRTLIDLGMTTVDEQRGLRGWEKYGTEYSDVPFKAVNMAPADLLAESFKNMSADEKTDAIKNLNELAARFDQRMEREENND